ncbi:hypothetical protein RRG08_006913 [Elysia crispata]|uniref:Uncharacterized protein n=1 Tax=Elysia crispata TaxID=231223 RepID=A0AAE1BC24_9GAST|nr:hypothetical protein RRG08_006913 [Elysia crispata]
MLDHNHNRLQIILFKERHKHNIASASPRSCPPVPQLPLIPLTCASFRSWLGTLALPASSEQSLSIKHAGPGRRQRSLSRQTARLALASSSPR